jgi:Domain of Unknown Function (DUF1521)
MSAQINVSVSNNNKPQSAAAFGKMPIDTQRCDCGPTNQTRDQRGSDFIAKASVSLGNRSPLEKNFDTAFASPAATQPPAQSNPSNASTTMQNGKAVYNDNNYSITADDDSNVKIFNKKTQETYEAWGDPHMKIDGKQAFDFYGKTSFKLAGGPTVTLDTIDAENQTTYSSKLTITNGGYGAQIIGIDGKTKGDLAVKEFENQGRELDKLVDDGVVLEENENMNINGGRGFVVTDPNGLQKQVDQSYINSVDLKKTKGQSSQNVNQFDNVVRAQPEKTQPSPQVKTFANCEPRSQSESSARTPSMQRSDRTEYMTSGRSGALRSLMNYLKPAWDDCFKPAAQKRNDRQVEKCEPREIQRTNRPRLDTKNQNYLNANLNVGLNMRSAQSAKIGLQVWG